MIPLLITCREDRDKRQGLHSVPRDGCQALMDAVMPPGTAPRPQEEKQEQNLFSAALQPGNQQLLADVKQKMKPVPWSWARLH